MPQWPLAMYVPNGHITITCFSDGILLSFKTTNKSKSIIQLWKGLKPKAFPTDFFYVLLSRKNQRGASMKECFALSPH